MSDNSEAPSSVLNIEKINAAQVASAAEEPDRATSANLKQDERREELELQGIAQDMGERRKYAFRVFLISAGWVTAIFVMLVLDGFGSWIHFRLSDSVLLAAIGSTTVNILGIFYIVVRYLFPKKH